MLQSPTWSSIDAAAAAAVAVTIGGGVMKLKLVIRN